MTRACWHMPAASTTAAADPFAAVAPAPAPDRSASDALVQLVNAESELGIECSLKHRDWANPTCSSCPERDTDERRALCAIGVTQEALVACLR